MFIIYSLQFFFIVIQVTIMGEALDKYGLIFTAYAFIDMFIILGYFVVMLSYAASCNQMDHSFKNYFVRLK